MPAIETAPGRVLGDAQLPVVSFIVVNYNYGRFLRQCVDSIFAQTYPAIECIVVDNKSTDESPQVIAELKAARPQLEVIYESANLGQSAACLDGYWKSRGPYVAFVDADDYYFDTFAETHVLVHLSLRQAVGFTSSDMTQVADGAIVLGTIFAGSKALDKRLYVEAQLNTPRHFPKSGENSFQITVNVENLPLKGVSMSTDYWVWSPTSGTMYRRDALEMFVGAPQLPTLRYSTDAYFNIAINALVGSVLIEKPLAVYRIHDANAFANHPSLNNIRGFKEEIDLAPRAAKIALTHIIENLDVFRHRTWNLVGAMETLNRKANSKRGVARDKLYLAALRLYWRIKIRLS